VLGSGVLGSGVLGAVVLVGSGPAVGAAVLVGADARSGSGAAAVGSGMEASSVGASAGWAGSEPFDLSVAGPQLAATRSQHANSDLEIMPTGVRSRHAGMRRR